MLKFTKKEKGDFSRGFTRWVAPNMRKYFMGCCDCGLVHEMQFTVIEITKRYANGSWRAKALPRTTHQVRFRARRAEAYTARERKRMA